MDGLDATGRQELITRPAAHHHAEPIAVDQPASLVGDRIGRGFRVQGAVHGGGELAPLSPRRLSGKQLLQVAIAVVVAGQFARRGDDPFIAPLDVGTRLGPLKYLDDPPGVALQWDRAQNQQAQRRVADRRVPRVRWSQRGLTALGHTRHQTLVPLTANVIHRPEQLVHTDLVSGCSRPVVSGIQIAPPLSGDSWHQPVEQLPMELRRRQIGFREPRDFRQRLLDRLPGAVGG